MAEFLSELAALTLGGSIAIVVLALTARMSRVRYAARWRCWLWLLLCVCMLVPFSIWLPEQVEVQPPIQITAPSNTVIYTYEPEEPLRQEPVSPNIPEGEFKEPAASALNAEQPVRPLPEMPEPKHEITLYQIVFAVWAAGAVLMVLWYGVSHLRFLRWLGRWGNPVINAQTIRMFNTLGDELELNRRPELLVCTGFRVPVLVGLISPKLLLPEGEMGENSLRYSLLHELTHFKRRDIWLKSLALLVNAVHWFNPLMWYMTRLIERDTELACDEAALKKLPVEEHGGYGTTILDAVERLRAAH